MKASAVLRSRRTDADAFPRRDRRPGAAGSAGDGASPGTAAGTAGTTGSVSRATASLALLLVPIGPGVVERGLCLLLGTGHGLGGFLLAVEHAVHRVLPRRLELVVRRVGRERERVVVGFVHRVDGLLPRR